ncbi:hypothetical protein KC340_g12249 [Hortaea werneckii]|nr:hypothetical protein KC342_g3380 [Hortaea werneckii]KAI7108324.1 hypothetical protein KC339_g1689 [Hortaea werneckii]KAI7229483.1 hypothetical protein KC365_g8008 [Hortaea werneckii]KAI7304344.1 hypothetical protein KC340_g12249 [Hortaea werneckii]KAI7404411.1 hypothetical protein KC328_g1970 [Hortaea werneckii]
MKKEWRRLSTRNHRHAFTRFFELPRELRDIVYEYYFSGDVGLATSSQPRSIYAAAILLANKQLLEEARPLMFEFAAFNVSLNAKFSAYPDRDLVYYLDHHMKPAELFTGCKDVFQHFKHLRFHLDSPRSNPRRLRGPHWQRAITSLVTTELAIPHQNRQYTTIAINLGNLSPTNQLTKSLKQYAVKALTTTSRYGKFSSAPTKRFKDNRAHLSDAELMERGVGRQWEARTKEESREVFARFVMLHYLGQLAFVYGAGMTLESATGKVVKDVTKAETVLDLLKGAVGVDDKGEVWLCVGAGRK